MVSVGVLFVTGLILAGIAAVRRRLRVQEREAAEYQSMLLEAHRDAMRAAGRPMTTAALRETDPGFDEEYFLERVRQAFLVVQEAHLSGELERARAFVSDGILERLEYGLRDERLLGARRELRDLVVEDAGVALLRSGAVFDELTVGIRARARLRRVRLRSVAGGAAAGDGVPVDVGEFWTFLRRRGAKTRPSPGLLEGRCPNCGAPIAVLESAICGSCGSKLRSGVHDWVLSDITQPRVWRPRAASRIPGVPELLEVDPGFSVQHLEDRAGVIFWRRLLAEREGRTTRLEDVASPAFCAEFAAERGAAPPGHGSSADVEIQGITIRSIHERDGWHRAAVLVSWVGRRLEAELSGQLRPSGGPVRETTLCILARKVGARTDADDAISSAHCPGCGAPASGGQGGSCSFCGLVLNDGTADWILVDAAEARSSRGRSLLQQLEQAEAARRAAPEVSSLPDGAFAWLVRVLAAEGPIAPETSRAIAHLAPAPEAGGGDPHELLRAPHDVRRSLPAIIDLALAHGTLGRRARTVLRKLAARARLTALDVRMLIDARTREWDGRAEAAQRAAEEFERAREHADWRARLSRNGG